MTLQTLAADMRRKYQHALGAEHTRTEAWIKGDPITSQILRGWIPEVEAADAELAALRAERDKMAALVDACAPYLKEGETPAERIERERRDLTTVVGSLARERDSVALAAGEICRLGGVNHALRARVAELTAMLDECRPHVRGNMGAWSRMVTECGYTGPAFELATKRANEAAELLARIERASASAGEVRE